MIKKTLSDIELPNYLESKTTIKSGIKPLDTILSNGFTAGEIVQLVGTPKVGKTILALQIAYGFCIKNKNVLYIDTKNDVRKEHLDLLRLSKYINVNFYFIKESIIESVENILDKFIETEQIDLIIIDSLPSLISEKYLQTSGNKRIKCDNHNTNSSTRPLIFLINKLKKLSQQYNICLLFVNEFRNKIDKRLGTLPKIFGPKCLEYETSDIIQVRKITNSNKDFKNYFKSLEDAKMGISDELISIKSSALKPPLSIPFFFEHGKGYVSDYSIIYLMILNKEITQNGTYFQYEQFKANGLLNLLKKLSNEGILQSVIDNARAKNKEAKS